MKLRHLLLAVVISPFAACYQFEVSAQGGYSMLSLDGDLGYVSGSTSTAVQQDLESGFGLGDEQGSLYARAAFDLGVPTFAVSAFMFDDAGQGVLTADFGNNLTVGTTVLSDLEMMSAKTSCTFEIPIGNLSLAPGIAVNFVDLDVNVRDSLGIASEDVKLQAPLPMLFARAELDLDVVTLVGEAGYVQVDIEDIDAKMLDLEALLEFNLFDPVDLFVGYRLLNLQGEGLVDGDAFDLDLTLSGLFVGGGITF